MNIKNIPKEKNVKYFIMFFSLEVTLSVKTSIVATLHDPTLAQSISDDYPHWKNLIISIVFAPILETLIFQVIVIEILFKTKLPPIFIILISGVLFGASHGYNWVYVIVTALSGFLYALFYVMLRAQGNWNKILLITLLHAGWNLIAFLNNRIFHWI